LEQIGVGNNIGGNAALNYGQMDFYSIRLYNTPLSTQEIQANYNTTVSYHNILVNGGNAETGGNTGGSDLENVETN
jgi:hypothetical protein